MLHLLCSRDRVYVYMSCGTHWCLLIFCQLRFICSSAFALRVGPCEVRVLILGCPGLKTRRLASGIPSTLSNARTSTGLSLVMLIPEALPESEIVHVQKRSRNVIVPLQLASLDRIVLGYGGLNTSVVHAALYHDFSRC